jgi:hypothetical protein
MHIGLISYQISIIGTIELISKVRNIKTMNIIFEEFILVLGPNLYKKTKTNYHDSKFYKAELINSNMIIKIGSNKDL